MGGAAWEAAPPIRAGIGRPREQPSFIRPSRQRRDVASVSWRNEGLQLAGGPHRRHTWVWAAAHKCSERFSAPAFLRRLHAI